MSTEKSCRAFERIRQRVPCVIRDGEEHHQAFVTDLSPSGLFLQTRAKLASSSQVVLELDWDGESIVLTGDIVRVRKTNRSAVSVNVGGFGCKILSAPETYFRLIVELQAKTD